ncbi:MAG TPA: SdrD B-like domain-containing protein [Candidatus Methanoperedens sp.]
MKLLLFFIISVMLASTVSAAEISGSVISDGKKLTELAVVLSKVNGTTQSDQSMTGVVYDFIKLSETTTDKNGIYSFSNLNSGMYRINVTYNGTVYGENTGLKDRAIVNFNLSGKIEGYVLKANKTLEGIPVRLMDAAGIEVMGTTTGKNGKYSFNKVDAGKRYFVEATYADVPYTQQVNASENADFTVYESTKDDSIIEVIIDHIVLSKAPNGVKVDEYVQFTNIGDKVFFSKDRVWLGISTPEGISRFQTDAMECCLQREKDSAWIDPMRPVMPGESYTAQVSYVLNSDSPAPTFSKKMIYNTSYMSLLSEKNNGFGIESKYARKEIVPNEGKEFEVLSFGNVQKGQIIDTQITGYVPSKSGIGGDLNYLIPALAVILIGAVSYPLLKNKIGKKQKRRLTKISSQVQAEESPEAQESSLQPAIVENVSEIDIGEMSFDQLLAEKKAVFGSILVLDNKFNSGEIADEEYKKLRKEYKERSVAVIKQLKEAALNLDLSQPVPEIEKVIAYVDDVDILEELLEREKEGENRDEIKKSIEQRIDDIEQNE